MTAHYFVVIVQVASMLETVALFCENGQRPCDVEVSMLSPAVKGLFLLAYQVRVNPMNHSLFITTLHFSFMLLSLFIICDLCACFHVNRVE